MQTATSPVVQACANGTAVERNRFARVGRQDEQVRRQLSQTGERRKQRTGPVTRGVGVRMEVRTTHAVREQRVAGEDRDVVQHVRHALLRVPRCRERAECRLSKTD